MAGICAWFKCNFWKSNPSFLLSRSALDLRSALDTSRSALDLLGVQCTNFDKSDSIPLILFQIQRFDLGH